MMTMEAFPLYCCCGLTGFGIGFFFLAGGGTFLGAGFGGMFPVTGRTGCPAPVVVAAVTGGWFKPRTCDALAGGLDAVG
jgi:hypothetical protein